MKYAFGFYFLHVLCAVVVELSVTCGGFVLHPSWKLNMFALCFGFVTRIVGFGFMYAFDELFSRLYIFQSYFCFLFFIKSY